MIISHKYKFIFIKNAKTAGTSIEVFLSPHCGDADVLTPIFPEVDSHKARNYEGFFNHMPAYAVKEKLTSDIWDNYYKFCVERNPWDKTISHYNMVKYRSGGNLSLDEFLARRDLPINFPKYMDKSCTNIIVDRVVKYENLNDELGEVFSLLGVPFDGVLHVKAKSEYRNDRRPYQELFTREQACFIERAFSKEIELHGYVF